MSADFSLTKGPPVPSIVMAGSVYSRASARPGTPAVILNRTFCGEESVCLNARSRCFAPLSMTPRYDAPHGGPRATRPCPPPVILNRAFCGEESACLKARSRCFAPLSMTARYDAQQGGRAPHGPAPLHVAKCLILRPVCPRLEPLRLRNPFHLRHL